MAEEVLACTWRAKTDIYEVVTLMIPDRLGGNLLRIDA